jgi:hypothetical protein
MKRLLLPFLLLVSLVGPLAGLAPAHATTSTMQGRIVDASTGSPVGHVTITARDVVDHSHVYAKTVSGPKGYFTLKVPSDVDEFGVFVNGSAVGYEMGWLACDHSVVSSWGAACSHGAGGLGQVRLDHT